MLVRRYLLFLLAIAVAISLPAGAAADSIEPTAPSWAISAGLFDTARSELTELGVQYRFAPVMLFGRFQLVPMIGISANEEGGVWAYGGARYDWRLGERWRLTPSFAFAFYEQGDGKDLGQTLEFRSSIELSRQLRSGHRIGAAFYHLSNARLSDVNPGSNSLVLVYAF